MESIRSAEPSVSKLYHEAAKILEIPGGPAGLALTEPNMPKDPVERQGFIGVSFLIQNLAIFSNLRERAIKQDNLQFAAFTGESFGMVASSVAAGSLSLENGLILARVFTPLLLAISNQRAQSTFDKHIEPFIPQYPAGSGPILEPAHVISLRAFPDDLSNITRYLRKYCQDTVEIHKHYSKNQINIYVQATYMPEFVRILRDYPHVKAEELKKPTKFMAHSRRMIGARIALDRFIDAQRITFHDPHIPLISNNGKGLLTKGDQVRHAILSMTNEVMNSQRTAEIVDEINPDLVAEIGHGGKSIKLLRDNAVRTGATIVANSDDASTLLYIASLGQKIKSTIRETASREDGRLLANDFTLLRDSINFSVKEPVVDDYLKRVAYSLAFDATSKQKFETTSAALRNFRKTLQYTLAHRRHIQPGELVLNARLRKRILGEPKSVGQAFIELRTISKKGKIQYREAIPDKDTEALVIHFERSHRSYINKKTETFNNFLDEEPIAQRIQDTIVEQTRLVDNHLYRDRGLEKTKARLDAIDLLVQQLTMLELLKLHRPELFKQSHVFFEGSDAFGWLLALVSGEAVGPGHVVEIAAQIATGRASPTRMEMLIADLCTRIRDATYPLLSTQGSPLISRRDIESETKTLFSQPSAWVGPRLIRINASCTIVALGDYRLIKNLDTSPHYNNILCIRSPEELLRKGLNPGLDEAESRALLAMSWERNAITTYAQKRNFLHSTISSYLHPDDTLVGFGEGGSESLTIFFRREGDSKLLVRKVLSEALTTAKWNPQGKGPMLPPFIKAKKQAEYLAALPENLRNHFPHVNKITERCIPLPGKKNSHGWQELIYEMTFIPGIEVGKYIHDHVPPVEIIARLYEQVITFIHHKVHTQRRSPAPGNTLEEQYFRKIENRLDLCRQIAPRTFDKNLIDSDEIIINRHRYRNHKNLLKKFRSDLCHTEILEPKIHSLVIGDTNTENIKIGNLAPLLTAQRLIESGENREKIEQALASITSETLALGFLDPRAIGYHSAGANTRDDPMYDNKPWHNSIGHYDEIHNNLFVLDLSSEIDGTQDISIKFHAGNPYQRAYKVRDITEHGGAISPENPIGLEDYFANVMSEVYQLGDPASEHHRDDPQWITRFVFTMGTHFTAMPPFHFQSEVEGTVIDTPEVQRRPVAIYCEGIKWLNWALEMLEGKRSDFLGIEVPARDR
ncbi:ACP S-malonyltransferase [Modicisalibacter radicis]|uniref:ACP S-malonyltransferase n=1 Tax=Halomonas sp. EAR18 TaxID=2518972 RepID=UPI00109C43D6|nr:ACP S-malonyltransferase [Halomonas sp. EAR18]